MRGALGATGADGLGLTLVPLGVGGALAVRYDAPVGSTATSRFVLDVYGYFK